MAFGRAGSGDGPEVAAYTSCPQTQHIACGRFPPRGKIGMKKRENHCRRVWALWTVTRRHLLQGILSDWLPLLRFGHPNMTNIAGASGASGNGG
jgi:hypothetical protein